MNYGLVIGVCLLFLKIKNPPKGGFFIYDVILVI